MRTNSRVVNQIAATTFGVMLALLGQSQAHAADAWLACKGTVTMMSKAETKSEPSERVLVYDDQTKNLYQWSEQKKTLSIMPTTSYSGREIRWGANLEHTGGMWWNGRLDRTKLSVSIERSDRDLSRMTWAEMCSPTQPLDGNPPAVASGSPEKQVARN